MERLCSLLSSRVSAFRASPVEATNSALFGVISKRVLCTSERALGSGDAAGMAFRTSPETVVGVGAIPPVVCVVGTTILRSTAETRLSGVVDCALIAGLDTTIFIDEGNLIAVPKSVWNDL